MMNVATLTKTKLVSAHDLSRIVDEAVKSASHVRDSSLTAALSEGHNLIFRPDILGRIVRDAEQATNFSNAVAKGVGKTGIAVDPVVIPLGPNIHLAGFIERDALQAREF